MKSLRILVCCILPMCLTSSYADTLEQDKLNSTAKIAEKSQTISVKLLDDFWEKRQTVEEQTTILKFIQSFPQIPADFDISWRISRLVYFIGNFGVGEKLTNKEKIDIFKYGSDSGLMAKKLNPNRVEGFFWYAINLGSYGLEKGIMTALSNAKAGRDALLEAAKIDPTYMWAGPYRILGRYYQEVPSVISFGDKKIAEDYYNKAIEIAPKFRLNALYLGRLKNKTGDKDEALKLFAQAKDLNALDGRLEEERYLKEIENDIQSVVR